MSTGVPPPPEPDLAGTALGPWQLERLIGEGAMGRVYLAAHRTMGREAAVKVLKAEHLDSPELVGRFLQEARAVNAIHDPHIVEALDFGDVEGPDGRRLVYCVMERLHGFSLAELPRPLTVRAVARVGQQLGQALHAAHLAGVVHRDIKPDNVFLHHPPGGTPLVKVLDFGVAKLLRPLGDLPSTRTAAGFVVGTPDYMAPEQATGTAIDVRTDLWAVGLLLYELLTGQLPFRAPTFGKLVVEITQKPAPPLPPLALSKERIPAGLAAVVLKCLRKDPDARYASGLELSAALEPFTGTGSPPVEPTEPPDVPIASLRHRPWRAVLVLAALALALAGMWAAWPASGPRSDTERSSTDSGAGVPAEDGRPPLRPDGARTPAASTENGVPPDG